MTLWKVEVRVSEGPNEHRKRKKAKLFEQNFFVPREATEKGKRKVPAQPVPVRVRV